MYDAARSKLCEKTRISMHTSRMCVHRTGERACSKHATLKQHMHAQTMQKFTNSDIKLDQKWRCRNLEFEEWCSFCKKYWREPMIATATTLQKPELYIIQQLRTTTIHFCPLQGRSCSRCSAPQEWLSQFMFAHSRGDASLPPRHHSRSRWFWQEQQCQSQRY